MRWAGLDSLIGLCRLERLGQDGWIYKGFAKFEIWAWVGWMDLDGVDRFTDWTGLKCWMGLNELGLLEIS